MGRTQLVDGIREAASLLGGSAKDYDPLLELAQGVKFVCLGEATHGSHELYRERARITQRLIAEQGFNGVCVEADWPDAFRAGRWAAGFGERDGLSDARAAGRGNDAGAEEALGGFRRFPAWMWRNTVVADFLGWLRDHNADRPAPAVFCGMDLYSLHGSIAAVIAHLDAADPDAADRARARYACFETHGEGEEYGRALRYGMARGCEDDAVQQLLELQQRAAGTLDPELFSAEQNARLARNAEAYYRAMFGSRISTWNLRDRHMAETLEQVAEFLVRRDGYARIAVWAHNSHLGDARATQMGEEGELNVGQLLREKHGDEALLIGFTTYEGTVTAAEGWGDPPSHIKVRPAAPESVESVLHEVALPRFFLPLRSPIGEALGQLREPMLERAIGVVYRPHSEWHSHYFEARVAAQFDALVHVDRTRAVEPLERAQMWTSEPPETYPSAL